MRTDLCLRPHRVLLDAFAASVLAASALGSSYVAAQPAGYDPALAPVDAENIQAVLDRDLERALKSGALAPRTSSGVAIGVLRNGVRRVFSYGTARPDSIFEIGSVTKTFTGLILAQMIEQRKVQLHAPVRELLPAGTVAKPQGREITLLDLVTHHSGLPRMPDNLHPADPSNPYADYRAAELYAFIGTRGVERPENARFSYSNVGFGLLGQALADRAKTPYARLLEEQITAPLGLKDTVISLTPQQQARVIQGHTADHRNTHAWDLDALAGTGAIRSTADDLLTYLEANLHPEKIAFGPSAGSTARALPKAITLSHEVQDEAESGSHIAFAWLVDPSGIYWHNGGTGGYSSFVFFNPAQDSAAVVLVNMSSGNQPASFAERLGQHIGQRLAGLPALSLAN
jgi:D-alanyl-D-alanine-carboxypeptidase/D-alanyl-D-alanine-endopeptidase